MSDISDVDITTMNPVEGLHTAAAIAQTRGLNPFKVRMHPANYSHVEVCLNYRHEYIDEEDRSYLVIRIPERMLVFVDRSMTPGFAVMECRNPDVTLRLRLP